MPKIDLKKEFKHLYKPPAKKFTVVDVPPMNFLMIDGQGDPNTSQAYQEAIEALYAAAYTLKFMLKKYDATLDFTVMPLESLWWTEDEAQFSQENKDAWQWTALIVLPDHLSGELVDEALKQAETKKSLPGLARLRFERFHEGLAVQIMYTGPYADEGPTIARLHQFIEENRYRLRGKHHEIYLSDPRRTAPEKLKTVIRQPVRAREAKDR
jgi:hypothetical protein